MIRHNEQLWKAAEEERKFNERANELMECFATYVTERGGVRSGECKRYKPNEPRDCEACEAHKAFYKAVRDYIQADDVKSPSEAIWLTCQFYDLPNAYMCDGNEERWLKEYQPERYKELLRRQAELMGDPVEDPEEHPPVRWDSDQLQGQMSIFDFLPT